MEQKRSFVPRQDSDESFDEIFGLFQPKCNESRIKSSQSSTRRPYSFSLNTNEVRKVFNPEKKDKNEKYEKDSSRNKSLMSGFDRFASEQKIQEPRRSKSKGSQRGDLFGEISSPSNRFPRRRQNFRIEDYSKYMQELDSQAQNMSKIEQSSRQIRKESSEMSYDFQFSEQISEVQRPNLVFKKSRKRAPPIEKAEEKPAFLRPVILREKQKQPKVKTQMIQQKMPENNFNSLSLKFIAPEPNNNKKDVICFHCGGPHYANQCTSQTRDNLSQKQIKCYNCKKQGHTTKYCSEKWCCMKCGSPQHFAKDCFSTSSLTFQPKICNNCLQQGHYKRQCTENARCFLCREEGHQRKDCPKNKQPLPFKKKQPSITIECYNCKKIGHFANQCKEPLKCHKCGLTGHYARDCPHLSGSFSFNNPKVFSNSLQNNQNFQKKSVSFTLRNNQNTKAGFKAFTEKHNVHPNFEKFEKKRNISRPDVRRQQKDIQI